jgi:hypothetical protein
VQPDKFEILYDMLKQQLIKMYEAGEPNIVAYYNDFDEIVYYLRGLVLKV